MSNTDIYHKKKYKNGFVLIPNPNYDGSDEDKEFITRKPNPSERRQIIVNYIADTTRKNISIPYLAKKLCVSDRTIQFDLKKLKELKLIEAIPQYDEETHAQIESKYEYIGPKRTAAFKRLTLSALYNSNVDIGIRDFDWDVFYNEDFDEDNYYAATYNAVNLMNAQKRAFKDVYSLDYSSELCRLANNKGLKNIINKSILDVDYKEEFDGIWACASLLHLDNRSLLEAFHIISNSLKEDGIIYVSFKYGTFSGYINDRYYTYLTEEELLKYIPNNLKVIDVMITKDVRDDKETKWLNAIIKKI